jgi:hypothetical protein
MRVSTATQLTIATTGAWTFDLLPPEGSNAINCKLSGYGRDGWKDHIRDGSVQCEPDMPVFDFSQMDLDAAYEFVFRAPIDSADTPEGVAKSLFGGYAPLKYDHPWFGCHSLDHINPADYLKLAERHGVPRFAVATLMAAG